MSLLAAAFLLMIGSWLNRLMGRPKDEPQQQEPPKHRLVYDYNQELPEEIFAIVRLTWHRDGKANRVDEVCLIKEDELYSNFSVVLAEAIDAGADITIKTSLDSEVLGIQEVA